MCNAGESLLKDTPNKGHHRKYLSIRTLLEAPKMVYPIMVVILFSSPKSGQPLYSGQISWSQYVFIQRFYCSIVQYSIL